MADLRALDAAGGPLIVIEASDGENFICYESATSKGYAECKNYHLDQSDRGRQWSSQQHEDASIGLSK